MARRPDALLALMTAQLDGPRIDCSRPPEALVTIPSLPQPKSAKSTTGDLFGQRPALLGMDQLTAVAATIQVAYDRLT